MNCLERALPKRGKISKGACSMINFIMLPFIMAFNAQTQSPATGFLQRKVVLNEREYCYQVFIPKNYSAQQKWPMLLFLHGAGERGNDCNAHTLVGLGKIVRQQSATFPFIVVMPQCRRGQVWHGEMEQQALQALEQTVVEFNGDRNRIYLTGLSMGGYGAFYFAANHPEKFAALVAICGGVVPPRTFPFPPQAAAQIPQDQPYETIARKIRKTPVWIFHGSADRTIPVTESRNMAAALRALGGNVKYTEYEGVEHNSWDRAYAEKELFPWLLGQKLK